MAVLRAGRAVHAPNLGLYYDRPPMLVPERAVQAPSKNFRIANGEIVSDNLGWGEFPGAGETQVNLDGKPTLLIEQFKNRSGLIKTIFGNTTDLFEYDAGSNALLYLTPRVVTGTVDVTNDSPTVAGTGASWNTAGDPDQLKAGDFIHIGTADERDPAETWYEIDAVVSDTEITLTENYAGSTDTGLDYTARSTFRSTLALPYFTESFFGGTAFAVGADGDRWYCTNNIDHIVAWDGLSQTQVYRPFIGTTFDSCAYMRRFENAMVFVAPRVDGDLLSYSVRTSATGQPENVTTLEASDFVIHDGVDPLVAALQLGELLAIYSERAITLAQFVGAPLMYVFRTAVSGHGPRASHAVAKFPDHHVFVSQDTMYRFDGVAARPHNNHVWKEVARTMSPQRSAMMRSHFDESRGDLLWVIPLNTDADASEGTPENAYTTHYLEDVGEDNPQAHSFRELPATALGEYFRVSTLTWADLTEAWTEYNFHWNDQFLQTQFPLTLFGDVNGDVWILNDRSTKNGTALPVTLRHSRRPIVDNRTHGVVHRVYPFIRPISGATHSVTVNVRTFDEERGDVKATHTGTFAVDPALRTNDFVAFRAPALYVEVEHVTTGEQEPFTLSGYDVDASKGRNRGRI